MILNYVHLRPRLSGCKVMPLSYPRGYAELPPTSKCLPALPPASLREAQYEITCNPGRGLGGLQISTQCLFFCNHSAKFFIWVI